MIVSADGAELFCTTRGDGPVCLVLTAIGAAPYERMMPAGLDSFLRLAFVELRGSGRSTGDAASLTFAVLADDLEAARRALGVERVAVFGHSILGALAIEYGRRCPESVSHLIAAGTPPAGDMVALSARAAAFFEEDASEDRKQVLAANLASMPANASPGQTMVAQTPMRFFDARLDAAPLFAGGELRPAFFAHLMGTLTRGWDVSDGASSLRVPPLLLVHGRYDYVVPHVLWDGIETRLPAATRVLFERSGHHPFVEEPERFAEVVASWMRAVGT